MDLPSGDHAIELIAPCRWLTCFILLPVKVQTKILFCLPGCNPASLPEQSDRNASCLPSGDQTGWEALHAPGLSLVASAMVSGERIRSVAGVPATPVRWSSMPWAPRTDHATVVPSGEMAAVTGVRTFPRASISEVIRGSRVFAAAPDAFGAVWAATNG